MAILSTVLAASEDQVHAAFSEAARGDLVERFGGSYQFIHDRVQEAAYSSIPDGQRTEAHPRIGRLMTARTPPEKLDDAIFEIVNQLNRGIGLIASRAEREQVAEFNLRAGRRAHASTDFASALSYFITGRDLLGDDCWARRPALIFALDLRRAECELLTGALSEAEERLAALSARAVDTPDRAAVARLRIDLYITRNQCDRAVAVGLDYPRHLGIDWSPHPADEEARRAYEDVWTELASRETEALIGLPAMEDAAPLAMLDVLNRLSSSAQYTDLNLYALVVCQTLALTLRGGNSDVSAVAYARLGMIAGLWFGDYERANYVAQVGHELVKQPGLGRFQAGVYQNFGNMVMPWTRHIRHCCELLGRAGEVARGAGDMVYAGVASTSMIVNLLSAGDPLADIQREAESILASMQRVQIGPVLEVIGLALARIRMLRGVTAIFGSLNDDQIDEHRIERGFADNANVSAAQCWYWVCKLQARFLAGDYAAAIDAASRAQPLLSMPLAIMQVADCHFYGALSHAALCGSIQAGQRTANLEALASHHKHLVSWAAIRPENFEDRAALVGAEVARPAGRELEAEQLYAQSVRCARSNGFVHNEALAHELASWFYASRGLEDIAEMHLLKARNGYLRWGADGKARQLETSHSYLRSQMPRSPVETIGAHVEQLDLATVIKVSQTVSREIVLETLIDTVMRAAVEQAGAERGVLIISRGGELRCAAEARTSNETIIVELRDCTVAGTALPQSVLQYVMRTREAIILDDAAAQNSFAADPYVCQRRARSVLCLPLLTQAKLGGFLYLENNLAPRVFVQARAAILKVLASQAAIALENASLYRDVAEREAKIRRLVDTNIIGTSIWEAAGPSIEANDLLLVEANNTFLHMVGYDREDLAAARLSRFALTPPEWFERDAQNLAELKMKGAVRPFEKEYLRKDGSRVPVLLGIAAFDERVDRGVAFVVDLTERKRAEAEARETQTALGRASDRLVQATQAANLAELSAAIAHEVNQPLAAIVANSHACYRWLSAEPANIERAKITVERITRDANSAGDVVSRIRALFRRAPHTRSSDDVNRLIDEVCRLMADEIAAKDIRIKADLARDLPLVALDRVQVQQVLVNLIRNGIEAMDTVERGEGALQTRSCRDGLDAVRVEVRDAGTGFQDAEHVFEPFFTTKQHGMGMGLAICRSIIESHGGRLWTANNETRGATVAFTLPLAADEAP